MEAQRNGGTRHQAVQPQAVRLQRLPAHESVANALREQILDGQLPPNSALRESDLCKAFDVSRHTVRSALHSLSFEGLVRQEAHRAAYIPLLIPADVEDIYEMRGILEREAVRRVAGNGEALASVREALDHLRDLGADAGWAEIRDADLDFHQRLVDGIGSERTSRAFTALRLELRLAFLQIRDELEDHAEILSQHEAIFAALEAGNAKRATQLLQRHLDKAATEIAVGVQRVTA